MNDRSGFTLVEMLVSLAIFAVITGFVMANLRVGGQGDELRLSSQLVASSVRRIQTMAVAGQTVSYCRKDGESTGTRLCPSGASAECLEGSCVKEVPPGGYGIRLSTVAGSERVIITFADLDRDYGFDDGEEIRREPVSSGALVGVSALAPEAGGNLDIVFAPNATTVYFNQTVETAIATVTLRHSQTGATKRVFINSLSGQISAE
ncbi:MAG: prepilin-type N-terminal cleavage/methylation domain-containing protein [Patescibacteria group bacterium]|jgi:prepilin-type N-terminal cleavage/methylation domain-containing protein